MNELASTGGTAAMASGSIRSTSEAKARLLAWADEHDARKPGVGAVAIRGALAVLGGVAIGRMLNRPRRSEGAATKGVGKRLIRWALLARVGAWLLPHAISFVRDRQKRGTSA